MIQLPMRFAVALGLSCLLVSEASAQRAKDAERIEALVRDGLAAESAGDNHARRVLFEAVLDIDPDSEIAHWHLGHVRIGDEWKTIAESEDSALADVKLNAYIKRRAEYGGSVDGQARLAAWCQRNELADQARAHWLQVLRIDPNGKQGKKALVALDATWYRGTLLTKEQAGFQRELDEFNAREFKALTPKIKTLRDAVLDGDEGERALAIKELRKIRGDVGVVAITRVLLKPTDDADQTAVLQIVAMKHLSASDSSEAVRILAWHAAMSVHESVREAARKELSRFEIYEYAPVLLAGMTMPIEVGVSTRIEGSRTATTLAVSREGPGGSLFEKQLQSYQSIGGSPTIAILSGTRNVVGTPTRLVHM
ncbi:MAG: hypothetical protein H8E66_20660 [Planctomycetes bacterium]|nr:hypothetical protein [Planctomycetota bacterium]